MPAPLKLFDLAGADPTARFSPNCWRIRLALAHKGLPVETVAWRFTDKDAIAPSGQGKVPVLVDGDRWLFESWFIATYLEETYPDRPSLFGGPEGLGLTRFVNQWTSGTLHAALSRVILPDIFQMLDPKDRGYFRATREAALGATIEEVASQRDEALATLRQALRPLSGTLSRQPFVAGQHPNYADHVVFGAFQWARVTSRIAIVGDDDPIAAWRERMLDAYGGLARATPAAG